MNNIFNAIFQETKEITLKLDFQKIYDFVKNEIITSDPDYNPTKWDVLNDFGDNMDYYIKKIYDYNIENNDGNDYTEDYIFEEWGKWVENNITDAMDDSMCH